MRRVRGKNGSDALRRPPALRQEDFVSIMREVTPQLITNLLQESEPMSSASEPSTSRDSQKRALSPDATEAAEEPSATRLRTTSPEDEVLSAERMDSFDSIDAFMADYLKRKSSKEFLHSNNPPELQAKVDLGKRLEWETMVTKPNVVKLHYGRQADRIRQECSHRFIGSRFVLTPKATVEGEPVDLSNPDTFSVKGRWCLQGHLDPICRLKLKKESCRALR